MSIKASQTTETVIEYFPSMFKISSIIKSINTQHRKSHKQMKSLGIKPNLLA